MTSKMTTLTYGSVCSGIEAATVAWTELKLLGERIQRAIETE